MKESNEARASPSFQFLRSFSVFLLSAALHIHKTNLLIYIGGAKSDERSRIENCRKDIFRFLRLSRLCARWKINYVLNLWSCRASKNILFRFVTSRNRRSLSEKMENCPEHAFLRCSNFNRIKFTVVKERCA